MRCNARHLPLAPSTIVHRTSLGQLGLSMDGAQRRVGSLVGRLRSLSRKRSKKDEGNTATGELANGNRRSNPPRELDARNVDMLDEGAENSPRSISSPSSSGPSRGPVFETISIDDDAAMSAALQALMAAEQAALQGALRMSAPQHYASPGLYESIHSGSTHSAQEGDIDDLDSEDLVALFAVADIVEDSDDVESPIPMSPLRRATVPPLGAVTRAGFNEDRQVCRPAVAGVVWSLFDGWFDNAWLGDKQWLGGWLTANAVPREFACVACLDKESDACLSPCGHTNLCMGCSVKLCHPQTCPICRAPIVAVTRVGRHA